MRSAEKGATLLVVQCLACNHKNPLGAKFCADCGSRLDLVLCKHCEAINDLTAQRCHQCGKELVPANRVAGPTKGKVASGSEVQIAGAGAPVGSTVPPVAVRRRISRSTLIVSLLLLIAAAFAYTYDQFELNPIEFLRTVGIFRSATSNSPPAPTAAAQSPVTMRAGKLKTDIPSAAPAASAPPVAPVQQPIETANPAPTGAAPGVGSRSAVTHTKGWSLPPPDAMPDTGQQTPTAGISRSETRGEARQTAAPSTGCTEGVVALGLCDTTGASKGGN
jgi:ribosomal protein L40E